MSIVWRFILWVWGKVSSLGRRVVEKVVDWTRKNWRKVYRWIIEGVAWETILRWIMDILGL